MLSRVLMIKKKKNKVAFTLTELAVAFIVLSSVGAMVSTEALNQAKRKANIEKVQETYNLLEKATMAWQAENDCYDDVKICVGNAKAAGVPNNKIFNGIAAYIPVVNSTVDVNAKGRQVIGEKFSVIDWLPQETLTPDGNFQSSSTMGVSKYYDGKNQNIAYYMLRDGVTISVNFSEYGSNSGYGFFDINGKEGENKIGVDVYPFSIGADIPSTHPLYGKTAKKFNPYFSSHYVHSYDLCNINKDSCINEKLASSNPTVYVLKWNKLP